MSASQFLNLRTCYVTVVAGLLSLGILGAERSHAGDNVRLVVQTGPPNRVSHIAISPNGKLIATTGEKIAKIWDVATGREIRTIDGPSNDVRAVAFSPDGKRLATSSFDGTVRLWDTATGIEVDRFEYRDCYIAQVAFSLDGRYIVTGCIIKNAQPRIAQARLWNVQARKEVRRFEVGHSLTSVSISRDGRYVVTGGRDETARLWDRETGEEVHKFTGHVGSLLGVAAAISPDGRYVVTCDHESKVARVWDTKTGKEVRKLEGHIEAVTSVGFSVDSRTVITSSHDGTVGFWDVATGRETRTVKTDSRITLDSAILSRDDRFLVTVSDRDKVTLWDVHSKKRVRSFIGYSDSISALALTSDGRHLAQGGHNGIATLWDLTTGKLVRRFEGHNGFISSLVFTPDNQHFFVGSDETVRQWNVKTGKEERRFGHSKSVEELAVSPNGRLLLTALGYEAQLWDLTARKNKPKSIGRFGLVTSLAFAPDGRHALIGLSDETAVWWNVVDGKETRRFVGLGEILSVAVSPDGRHVAVGTNEDVAILWDVSAEDWKHLYEGHAEAIMSVTFSPDGRHLLTGGLDDTAILWDVASGKKIKSFVGHAGSIRSVAFCPDGRRVLTGSSDKTTRLWDVATGKELCQLVSFTEGWAVIDPDGRFDTDDLDDVEGFHWIARDEPLRPLPVEIFMRDYFEPRLLARVMAGEKLPYLPDLSSLNRVQPKVEIKRIDPVPDRPDEVNITVEVADQARPFERDGKKVTLHSGVYDVRLFRDGQMVGYSPDYHPQKEFAVKLDSNGKQTIEFKHIRLPRVEGLDEVEFSAYAFNKDRVKSLTARKKYALPKNLPHRKGRAYVICLGVNTFENSSWNLQFAAADARIMAKTVTECLKTSGQFSQVVRIELVSDGNENRATKDNIRRVLSVLAGRLDPRTLTAIPGANQLQKSLPEDLLMLTFSTHGYNGTQGRFYLFPADVGSGTTRQVDEALLTRLISTDDLS
ncbi:MAG: PQQ-binding-like beta-propeller repeat protein, partial [Planctomycetes bacterium]|nr:PQQ-binding-like beta-propeller repeat protein [Planctomycetota bacterium]